MNRAQYMAWWSPKIGPNAAEVMRRADRLQSFSSLTIIVWFLSIAFGVQRHWYPLLGFGIALASAGVAAYVLNLFARHRVYTLASECLGKKLGPRNFPPPTERGYAKWCQREGVVPNAAGQGLGS